MRIYLGTTAIVGGAGAVAAGVPRVTLASDDPAVVSLQTIDNAISGNEMQVDIVSMPAVDTELTTADLDTGAGTDTRAVVGLVGSASGGGQLIPGSSTDGLLVNLGVNNDVTVTGSVTANAGTNLNTSALALESGGNLAAAAASLATLDNIVSGSEAQVDIVAALPAGTNNIGDVDVLTLPSIPAGTNNIGDVDILSIAAGDNNIGNVDIASIAAGDNNIGNVDVVSLPATPAGTNLIGRVQLDAQASNGYSPIKILDSDETEDEVKGTAGRIKTLYCFNSTNAILYVKLYNATAANVTVGTTTPVMTIPVPGNNDTDGAGVVLNLDLQFSTAITIATTTGLADNDTGAPGANAMTISGSYL